VYQGSIPCISTMYKRITSLVLFATLVAVNVLDVVSTHLVVSITGPSYEGNPFMRSAFESIGYGPSYVIKMIATTATALILCYGMRTGHLIRRITDDVVVSHLCMGCACLLVAFYSHIVINNFTIYQELS